MNKLLYILAILFSVVQGFGQSEEIIALNKGIEAYKKGEFNEALNYFNKAGTTNPDYKKAIFDAANAALLIDSTAIAKDLYTEYASAVDDKIEKSKAYYNLGNTQFKEYEKLAKNPEKAQESTKVLKECIESYKQALRNNYKDKDARYNLSLAMSKLPPENDQENKDNQNKDKENKDDQNKDSQDKENKDDKNKEDDNKDGDKSDDKKDGDKSDDGKDGDKSDDKKDDGKDGDKSKDEKGKEDKKDGEGKDGKEEKKDEQGKKDGQNKQGKEGEKGEDEMKGKISLMQAQKDLDAMNNEEQKTLMKVNRKKGNHKKETNTTKDW